MSDNGRSQFAGVALRWLGRALALIRYAAIVAAISASLKYSDDAVDTVINSGLFLLPLLLMLALSGRIAASISSAAAIAIFVYVLGEMKLRYFDNRLAVSDFPFLDEDVDVRLPELKAATALIDCLARDFDPTEHTDAYREALDELIEAKAAGNEVIRPEVPIQPNGSGDLLTALEASLKALEPKGAGAVRRARAAAKKAGEAADRAHKAARTAAKSRR